MKSFLQNRQTKDRLHKGASRLPGSFGFTLPTLSKDAHLKLRTLCTIASARRDEDLERDIAPGGTLTDNAQLLGWVIQALYQSETARDLLEEAADNGWSIELSDLDHHDFHLDVPEHHIILNSHGLSAASLSRSDYFRNLLLTSLVRALRDVWQEARHGGFEELYGPETILILERMRAADCDTISILIAWELRQDGFGTLWRHILGSEEGDLAMTFANYLERRAVDPCLNQALYTTFRQWFASAERINVCDHETLEYLDDYIAAQGQGSFGEQQLEAAALEDLSELPDGSNYLEGNGAVLITNPLYAGLNDPINKSHFQQIMHDMQAITVAGIPFRTAGLASKIFPEGYECDRVEA